jgi:hypothetical protein
MLDGKFRCGRARFETLLYRKLGFDAMTPRVR